MAQAVGLSLPTRAPALWVLPTAWDSLSVRLSKWAWKKYFCVLEEQAPWTRAAWMAAALGAKFYDKEFRGFLPVGKNLCEIRSVDFFPRCAAHWGLSESTFCTTWTASCAATRGRRRWFGPQKGLTPSEISFADKKSCSFCRSRRSGLRLSPRRNQRRRRGGVWARVQRRFSTPT